MWILLCILFKRQAVKYAASFGSFVNTSTPDIMIDIYKRYSYTCWTFSIKTIPRPLTLSCCECCPRMSSKHFILEQQIPVQWNYVGTDKYTYFIKRFFTVYYKRVVFKIKTTCVHADWDFESILLCRWIHNKHFIYMKKTTVEIHTSPKAWPKISTVLSFMYFIHANGESKAKYPTWLPGLWSQESLKHFSIALSSNLT